MGPAAMEPITEEEGLAWHCTRMDLPTRSEMAEIEPSGTCIGSAQTLTKNPLLSGHRRWDAELPHWITAFIRKTSAELLQHVASLTINATSLGGRCLTGSTAIRSR